MNSIDILRNDLISQFLAISDKKLLSTLQNTLKSSEAKNRNAKLSKEQVFMLQMSDADIAMGNVVLQSKLDKADLKWLKEL